MAHIDIECFRDQYAAVLQTVARRGFKRTPRGMPTRDLGYTTLVLHDPMQPVLPLSTGRRLGKTVAAIETLQVISGEIRPHLLLRAAPRFEDFMERNPITHEPTHFHGAYGLRIGTQLDAAMNKLKADRDTRQAVITLWDPVKDNQNHKRDYPCTVALGLSIVDDQLQLNVLMRSNDAWLGLPNDVFVFTQLQHTLAYVLCVDVGPYIHTAWSLHLYDDVLSDIDRVGPATREEYQPRGLICSDLSTARRVASELLSGTQSAMYEQVYGEKRIENDWLQWYVDALAPVVG